MMDIRDFLELFTDLSAVRVRVFDCRTEEIIFDSQSADNEFIDPYLAVITSDVQNEEIGGVDIYRDGSWIVLEFNVETEDPDD